MMRLYEKLIWGQLICGSALLATLTFLVGYSIGTASQKVEQRYWIKCRGQINSLMITYSANGLDVSAGGCKLTKFKDRK